MTADLDTLALKHLRAAHEPIREFALYDRVASDVTGHVSPELFVEAMERLMTGGRVHVSFDHESPQKDPPPFSPRYYRVLE